MKVKGSVQPPVYAIGVQPNRQGDVWIRLTENVRAITETVEFSSVELFEYDEYTIIEHDRAGLVEDVAQNTQAWLDLAKATEYPVGNSAVVNAQSAVDQLLDTIGGAE